MYIIYIYTVLTLMGNVGIRPCTEWNVGQMECRYPTVYKWNVGQMECRYPTVLFYNMHVGL